MNDTPAGPAQDDAEAWDRMLAKHDPPTPEVQAAMDELTAARDAFADSLDELTAATRSALDIPAKVRRNPLRTVALVGGTGFLLAGGPRRLLRTVGRRVRPARPSAPRGLLPLEIERVLKDAGLADDPALRQAIDEDFAEYLKSKGRYAPEPNAAASLWRTFDRVAGPLGTAGASILVRRLMAAEDERAAARRQRRQASDASSGSDTASGTAPRRDGS
jgi:hypothetical protein